MLNDNQREIVTKNHNLIYGFLNKYYLDIEEWYGDAAIRRSVYARLQKLLKKVKPHLVHIHTSACLMKSCVRNAEDVVST